MRSFSEQLGKIVREKNIKVLDLCKVLEIDRSTMYKILSGKRYIGKFDLVLKIIDYARLDDLEAEKLIKNYYRSKFGEEKQENIEAVWTFLNSNYWKNDYYKTEVNIVPQVIEGKYNIEKFVEAFLSNETKEIKVLLNHVLELSCIPVDLNLNTQVKILLSIDENKNNELSKAKAICKAVPHKKK